MAVRIQDETKNKNNGQQNQVPSMRNLLSKFASSGTLPKEANEYMKKIREILEDDTNPIKIKAKKLMKPNQSMLFHTDNYGVILIFDDMSVPNVINILRNDLIVTAIKSAKELKESIKILNVVIVTKHDYDKYDEMANYINKCFAVYENEDAVSFTIDSFNDSNNLIIEPNMDVVLNYFKMNYPHGVLPRHDIGILCYNVNGHIKRSDDIRFLDKTELFAAVGYTEIVPNGIGANIKLTPVIHVTGIVTPLPSPAIMPLIQATISEAFAAYELWKQPYRMIKKGSINIGNVIIDQKTNKPKEIKNEQELEWFFQEYFTAPVIVFDVTEGVARIPSLALYTDVMKNPVLSKSFTKFFKKDTDDVFKIVSEVSQDVIGYTNVKNITNNEVIDTRYIDYLNIVKLLGYDNRTSKLFFKYSLDPIQRSELIKSICSDTRFLYLNHECVLNGQITKDIVDTISKVIHVVNPINQQINYNIDVKNLLVNAYNNGPTLGGRRSPIPDIRWTGYDIV